MKAADQSQSSEKFQSVSIKNSSTQVSLVVMDCSIRKASNERIAANREQLWTAALEEQATKGLQLIKICKQLWTAASKRVSNERIAANHEQLWTAASKE